MFSTSSIFITVAMAKQRFDAIQNPVSYHNAQLDAQHLSCRALLRIFGLEFAAFLVSIPLFLEPMVVEVPFSVRDNVNETHMAMVRFFCSTTKGTTYYLFFFIILFILFEV